MRVLHFSETILGGPASYFEEIAAYQKGAFGASNLRFLIPHSTSPPQLPPECVHYFPRQQRTAAGCVQLLRHLRAMISTYQPDILHLHSSYAGAIGRIAALSTSPRPAVVYCAHGWSFSVDSTSPRTRTYAAIERLLAKCTDQIVNISAHEHAISIANGLGGKSVLIRNGIAPSYPTNAAYVSLSPSPLNMVFVGRHDPQKGLNVLIDAFLATTRSDIHLHIIGATVVGKQSYHIEHHPRITEHGWLPRSAANACMAAADCVVMPSRWEGFGLVAVEAMRAGSAVIASDVGALSEIIVSGETGYLFPSGDSARLAEIFSMLEKNTLFNMGIRGRERFRNYFSSDKMNKSLELLYMKLIRTKDILNKIG